MLKTNKSFTKRMKITKKGKILVRKTGTIHNNSRESVKEKMAKKKLRPLKIKNKIKATFLPKKVK